jgi:hypothetical protein
MSSDLICRSIQAGEDGSLKEYQISLSSLFDLLQVDVQHCIVETRLKLRTVLPDGKSNNVVESIPEMKRSKYDETMA